MLQQRPTLSLIGVNVALTANAIGELLQRLVTLS